MTLAERFWSKVDKSGSCWLWSGCVSTSGYGRINASGHIRFAHHIGWLLTHGTLPENIGHGPDEVVTDHLCRVRNCVNPAHLQWVSTGTNTRRGNTGQHNTIKTHCPKGHAYTADNILHKGKNSRGCRQCGRDYAREYQRRKRAS